ncbi:MAG: hypothetical protein GOV00_02945 [Candidatus Altiarchaeota archaeon]|nr:hypothetical protein [Candidatus Altiarchaeota archaeon]
MAWRNLRLFLLASKKIEPDSVMKKLQGFRFNGTEGINKFETWREFNEVRFNYLFVRSRVIKISKLKGRELSEETLRVETVENVEIHIRSNGVIEAYGSPALIEKAMENVSILGDVEAINFATSDFNRIMKMADDIRKVKIAGTHDEKITEVILKGGRLTTSSEFKKFKKEGQVKEIHGKLTLNESAYGFAMTEHEIRFFVRDPKEDQKDIELFVTALTS